MSDKTDSIFRRYYAEEPFVDRFLEKPEYAVDVIIPVVHTNELWERNLYSYYREIPIHNLLIGDGGCIDDTIKIVSSYPRVKIFDHRNFVSLGYSIRKLIEAVETDWFIYIHSDAYLPPGWFDTMRKYQTEYDWYGCIERDTVMVEYDNDFGERPWAGSQMGRKIAFESGLSRIDDDYVYRQEDFVFADIVKQAGFKEGRVTDTFHYHQTMHKLTPWARKVKAVKIDVELSRDEEVRTWMMQGKGIVKYLQPSCGWLINDVAYSFDRLMELKQITWRDCKQWIIMTNPVWWRYVRLGIIKGRITRYSILLLHKIYRSIFR